MNGQSTQDREDTVKHSALRKISLALVALVVAAAASAALAKPAYHTDSAAVQKKVKVGLLLPCAINDHTWCQAAYSAAVRLQKEGAIDLKYTSNAPFDTAAVSQLMAQYAQRGYQLVIGHSAWQDAAFSAAGRFPKTAFAYAGGGKVANNVATYEEPIYQVAYLAGILAGGITKTGVVGGLAGQDIPLCHAELQAFIRGAKTVRSNVRGLSAYIGDWSDVAKAKEAALAQADSKADVFIACGDGPSQGMIQALKERKLSGFGYVGNQNSLAPKNMVGSLVYKLYPLFKLMVQDTAQGKFIPAKDYDVGLKSFQLVLNSKYSQAKVPAKVMAQMKSAQKRIATGELKVPYIAK